MTQGPQGTNEPVAAVTPRHLEVLLLLAEERSANDIAFSLSISSLTVEFHKYQLMETPGPRAAAGLIHFAFKNGLVGS